MGELVTRVHRKRSSNRPWNSSESFRPDEYRYTPVHNPDNQKEIDLCINCPLPAKKCRGNGWCYEEAKIAQLTMVKQRKRHGTFDPDKYKKARENGMNDDQVAALFGVTKKTAARWRRRYDAERGV